MSELGPTYNVPLISILELESGFKQAMSGRAELQAVPRTHPRVVAGYEVLLKHYYESAGKIDALKKSIELGTTPNGDHLPSHVLEWLESLIG